MLRLTRFPLLSLTWNPSAVTPLMTPNPVGREPLDPLDPLTKPPLKQEEDPAPPAPPAPPATANDGNPNLEVQIGEKGSMT